MKKRTLEEIHRFNTNLENRRKREFKNMLHKDDETRKKYDLLHVDYLKKVILKEKSIEDFYYETFRYRDNKIDFPFIDLPFAHEEPQLKDQEFRKFYFETTLQYFQQVQTEYRIVEFLGNETKPYIKNKNIKEGNLQIETESAIFNYGLLGMFIDECGKFNKRIIVLRSDLFKPYKIRDIQILYIPDVYNYKVVHNPQIPNLKLKHYNEKPRKSTGIHFSICLSNRMHCGVSEDSIKTSLAEFVADAEERIVKYRIDLDKKPKVSIYKCPECGQYLEYGFNMSGLHCPGCDYVEDHSIAETCPKCGELLRYSEEKHLKTCTSCDYQKEIIRKCPNCGEGDVVINYYWDKKLQRKVPYYGCTNNPGCEFKEEIKRHK